MSASFECAGQRVCICISTFAKRCMYQSQYADLKLAIYRSRAVTILSFVLCSTISIAIETALPIGTGYCIEALEMDLSIHLRRMKFMQRGQSAELNQALQETVSKTITDEQWELDIPALKENQSKYDIIQSHVDICDLRYGRMSYQGFNEHTEKMMKVWNNEEEQEEDKESTGGASEASISDEEMAERYTSLVGTIAKKYGKKRSKSDNNDKAPKPKKMKKQQSRTLIKPEEDS